MKFKISILVLFLLIVTFNTRVVMADKIVAEKIPNYYVVTDDHYNKVEFNIFYNKNTNEFLYSKEPVEEFSNDNFKSTHYNHTKYLNISENIWHDIMNIIYFGYGYNGHDDIKWYVITQYMLWAKLDLNIKVIDEFNTDLFLKYQNEYKEINQLITEFYKAPSYFYNDSLNIDYGKEILLEDSNEIENEYKFTSTSSIKFLNRDGKKYLYGLKPHKGGIYCTRIFKSYTNNIVYFNDQFLLINRMGPKIKSHFLTVIVHGGFIKLKNINKNGDAVINSKYKITDEIGNIVSYLTVDENGVAQSKYLPLGKYYISEIKTPEGYKKNYEEIEVELNDIVETEVKIISEPISANIKINLSYRYEDSDEIIGEHNAWFAIYKNDELIDKKATDIYGNLIFELELGEYIIKHLSSEYDFPLQEEFMISVTSDTDIVYNFLNIKKFKSFNIKLLSPNNILYSEIIKNLYLQNIETKEILKIDKYEINDNKLQFQTFLEKYSYFLKLDFVDNKKYITSPLLIKNIKEKNEFDVIINLAEENSNNVKADSNLFLENQIEPIKLETKDEIVLQVPSTGINIKYFSLLVVFITSIWLYNYAKN